MSSLGGLGKKLLDPDSYDHPIPFLLFTGLALVGLGGLATWALHKAGLPGPVDVLLGSR